jgi:hypothetical protein
LWRRGESPPRRYPKDRSCGFSSSTRGQLPAGAAATQPQPPPPPSPSATQRTPRNNKPPGREPATVERRRRPFPTGGRGRRGTAIAGWPARPQKRSTPPQNPSRPHAGPIVPLTEPPRVQRRGRRRKLSTRAELPAASLPVPPPGRPFARKVRPRPALRGFGGASGPEREIARCVARGRWRGPSCRDSACLRHGARGGD